MLNHIVRASSLLIPSCSSQKQSSEFITVGVFDTLHPLSHLSGGLVCCEFFLYK